MAQKKKTQAKPQPKGKMKAKPKVSKEVGALRGVFSAVLIALGILVFLAVQLHMGGDVFTFIRSAAYGFCGAMSLLLPVVFVWGGVMGLLSLSKRVKTRTYWFFCLLWMLLSCLMTLITVTGSSAGTALPLLDYQAKTYPLRMDYLTQLTNAWSFTKPTSAVGHAGGVVGMALAWPLWHLGGTVLACVINIVVILIVFLLMIRLDYRRLFAMARESAADRHARLEEEREKQKQEDLQWKQQQMLEMQRRREEAVRQHQARAYQMQQQQQQIYASAPYVQPQRAPSGAMRPVQPQMMQQPMPQQPVANRQPTQYGFQDNGDEKRRYIPEEETEKRSLFSRLFKRNEEEEFEDEEEEIPEPQPVEYDQYRPPERVNTPSPAPVASPFAPAYQAPVRQQTSVPAPAKAAENPFAPPSDYQRPAAAKPAASASAPVSAPKAVPAPMPVSVEEDEDLPPWDDEEVRVGMVKKNPAPQRIGEAPRDLIITPPGEKETYEDKNKKKEEAEKHPALSYIFPSMDLLKPPTAQAAFDPNEDARRARKLEETLGAFNVEAHVRHITHGPAISRFELELGQGINVNRVTNLGQNIAMDLEVVSVRIEAPIPGKSLVGVEIPNKQVSTVTLREVLDTREMQEAQSKPLIVALGKDIAGTPVVCDLAKMPHLLIAGATGSGKSVCINTMINSLLYRCSPHDVRMILIDPKVVELQCYNGIPHLLIPVVSNPQKASGALAWAVGEMMDRYKKFERAGVRAIDGYNAQIEDDSDFMPRIVIVIDELADLMMTCKREVEDHICRLAQLARAAGIHLVVATQRPSVDVITGLIKANIPSRIAFKVTSGVDSRTILDRVGAEQLLGWGDMLYQPTGAFTARRVQGCFLSDNEVNDITDYIRATCPGEYDPDIMAELDALQAGADPNAKLEPTPPDEGMLGDGPLLQQAIEMAVRDGQVSTSLIQRRLSIGYARAGRLVDEMEKRGIVGPKDGAKPRKTLITLEDFDRMLASGDLME